MKRPKAPASYYKYINSCEWKHKRQLFLDFLRENDLLFCVVCKDQYRSGFHVHHITYERFGREEMCDLELICNNCHRKTHSNKTNRKRSNSFNHRRLDMIADKQEREKLAGLRAIQKLSSQSIPR